MRFSGRGVGWLIAGALICCSATEADGVASVAGTIAIGFVLITVYFMKQRFDPRGIGWFITGGIFAAFTLEMTLDVFGGFVSRLPMAKDDFSTILIGLIATAGFMFMFYRRNRSDLDAVAGGLPADDEFGFPYQEQVFREETVETVTENPAEADVEDILDIEITDGDE